MSKRGRSKPPNKKPTWKFHVPSSKPKHRFAEARLESKRGGGKSGKPSKPTKTTRTWSFNDPSKVPKVRPRSERAEQWERNNEIPGVRHEVPLDEPWDCKYGCEPFVWTQGQLHGWKCPYWSNEGGLRTPF